MDPCYECLNALRKKLFSLKSEYNMLSYNQTNKFIKTNSECHCRLYSDTHVDEKFINLEHVVPVNILSVNKRPDRNIININYEPVSDIHLILRCTTDINYLRGNKCYGIIFENRSEAIEKCAIIINNNYIYNPPASMKNKFRHLEEIDGDYLSLLNEVDDIYIYENIFQPKKKDYGVIARTIFYYFLMYGVDFSRRPVSNCKNLKSYEDPWFAGYHNNSIYCYNFKDWSDFFFDHIHDFKKWSCEPIQEEEHHRNIHIIKNLGVPNIFVGYVDQNGSYVVSNSDMVEELFFGKYHSHEKYTCIEFDKPTVKSAYRKNRISKNRIDSKNIEHIFAQTKIYLDIQKNMYHI